MYNLFGFRKSATFAGKGKKIIFKKITLTWKVPTKHSPVSSAGSELETAHASGSLGHRLHWH